jgi:hypothetical protein
MRLVDLVFAASLPVDVKRGSRHFRLPGAASFSGAVNECPLRYVMEESVLDATQTLLIQWADLLNPVDKNFRVPAESMWLEWTGPGSRIKFGVLLEASRSGRSGVIQSFWQNGDGADAAQISIHFDFDHIAVPGTNSFPLSTLLPRSYDIDDYLTIRVDDLWYDYFSHTSQSVIESVRQCVSSVVFDSYRLFAFSRIMSSRINMKRNPVDRSKLNIARSKSRKRPLLDHVELSMDINQSPAAISRGSSARATTRLHVVRGHLVRRNNNIFWRSTHLRGDGSALHPIKRTVKVR